MKKIKHWALRFLWGVILLMSLGGIGLWSLGNTPWGHRTLLFLGNEVLLSLGYEIKVNGLEGEFPIHLKARELLLLERKEINGPQHLVAKLKNLDLSLGLREIWHGLFKLDYLKAQTFEIFSRPPESTLEENLSIQNFHVGSLLKGLSLPLSIDVKNIEFSEVIFHKTGEEDISFRLVAQGIVSKKIWSSKSNFFLNIQGLSHPGEFSVKATIEKVTKGFRLETTLTLPGDKHILIPLIGFPPGESYAHATVIFSPNAQDCTFEISLQSDGIGEFHGKGDLSMEGDEVTGGVKVRGFLSEGVPELRDYLSHAFKVRAEFSLRNLFQKEIDLFVSDLEVRTKWGEALGFFKYQESDGGQGQVDVHFSAPKEAPFLSDYVLSNLQGDLDGKISFDFKSETFKGSHPFHAVVEAQGVMSFLEKGEKLPVTLFTDLNIFSDHLDFLEVRATGPQRLSGTGKGNLNYEAANVEDYTLAVQVDVEGDNLGALFPAFGLKQDAKGKGPVQIKTQGRLEDLGLDVKGSQLVFPTLGLSLQKWNLKGVLKSFSFLEGRGGVEGMWNQIPLTFATDLRIDQEGGAFGAMQLISGESKVEGDLTLPHYEIALSSGTVRFFGGKETPEWAVKGIVGELSWTEGFKGHLLSEIQEVEMGALKGLTGKVVWDGYWDKNVPYGEFKFELPGGIWVKDHPLGTLAGTVKVEADQISFQGLGSAFECRGAMVGHPQGFDLHLKEFSYKIPNSSIPALLLSTPLNLKKRGEKLTLEEITLGFGKGKMRLSGEIGTQAHGILQFEDMPLDPLTHTMSTLSWISGEMNGKLELSGTPEFPVITGEVISEAKGVDLGVRPVPPVTLKNVVDWQNGLLSLVTKVKMPNEAARKGRDKFVLTVKVPCALHLLPFSLDLKENIDLDSTLEGYGDLETISALFLMPGDLLKGRVEGSLSAKGPFTDPTFSGQISLTNGAFESFRYGTRLDALEGKIGGAGTGLSIQLTSGGGHTLKAEGVIFLHQAPKGSLNFKDLLAMDREDVRIQASGDLYFDKGCKGKIVLAPIRVTIPRTFPTTIPDVPTQHYCTLEETHLKEVEKQEAKDFDFLKDFPLEIKVTAPGPFSIEGHGLESQWGGEMDIQGTGAAPEVNGGILIKSGTFTFSSRVLDITHGSIEIGKNGNFLDPILSLVAQMETGGVIAKIQIDGSLLNLAFTLSSEPSMSEQEVMSYLLFGQGMGSLSPFQTLQILNGVRELSGKGPAVGIVDNVRKALGLTSLGIVGEAGEGQTSDEQKAFLSVGKEINDKITLKVQQGINAQDTRALIDIKLSDHLTLETGGGSTSGAIVGLNYIYRY